MYNYKNIFKIICLIFLINFTSFSQQDSIYYINKKGKLIFKGEFDQLNDQEKFSKTLSYKSIKASSGLCFVKKNESKYWKIYQPNNLKPIMIDSLISFVNYPEYMLIKINIYGKKGIINSKGKKIIDYNFKDINIINRSTFKVTPFDTFTVYNNHNSLEKTYIFDSIVPVDSHIACFNIEDQWGLIDLNTNKIISPAQFDLMEILNDSLIKVWKNDKSGLLHTNGKLILPCIFNQLSLENNQFVRVQSKRKVNSIINEKSNSEKWGLFTTTGKKLLPTNYDQIGKWSDGLFPVKKDNQWGYINESGKTEIPFFYEQIQDMKNGLAVVEKNLQYGILQKDGMWFLQPQYDMLKNINDSLWIYKKNKKYNFFSHKIKKFFITTFDKLTPVENGFFEAEINKKVGLVDPLGVTAAPIKYQKLRLFADHQILFGIDKDSSIDMYHYSGKQLCSFAANQYSQYSIFKFNLSIVKQKNKFGCIDTAGNEVIKCQYELIGNISKDLVAVKLNQKWGLIDHNNKFVTKPKFDSIYFFKDSLWIAQKDQKNYVFNPIIDSTMSFKYDSITVDKKWARMIVWNAGKCEIMNKRGEILSINQYENAESINDRFVKIKKYGKFGWYDTLNKKKSRINYFDCYASFSNKYIISRSESKEFEIKK